MTPNKSPEPTAVGAVSSAIAVHVASRRWLSFFVRQTTGNNIQIFFGGVNMAKILKNADREFKEDANKIDNFRLYSDTSRIKNGVRPTNLNFDLRLLNPGHFFCAISFSPFCRRTVYRLIWFNDFAYF